MRAGQLRGIVPDLAKEMTGRENTTQLLAEKLQLNLKETINYALGRSPDIADAFFLGLDLARQKLGIHAGSLVGGKLKIVLVRTGQKTGQSDSGFGLPRKLKVD
jgi:hypothetical protein